jgi:hypothetical protein
MPTIFIGTAIKPSVKDAFISIPYAPPAKFRLISNNFRNFRNIKNIRNT